MIARNSSRPVACALTICAGLFATNFASAQIPSENRAALIEKGYTAADFKAAEATQIGSNYALYSQWKNCVREVARIVAMNDITDQRVGIAFGQCNDEALNLRAGLARSMGLRQASRVIDLLNTDLGMETRRLFDSQHAKRYDAGGSAQAATVDKEVVWSNGPWSVRRSQSKGCYITQIVGKRPDGRDDIRIAIVRDNGIVQLRLIFAHAEAGDKYIGLIGKSLDLTNAFDIAGDIRKLDIKYKVLTNQYDIFLSTPLSRPIYELLINREILTIVSYPNSFEPPVPSGLNYNLVGMQQVFDKMAECNRQPQ